MDATALTSRARRPRLALAIASAPLFLSLAAVVATSPPTRGGPVEAGAEFWMVHTRLCPQVMGTDPWPDLVAIRYDARGRPARRHPDELLAMAADRPVTFLIHGSYYSADLAATEGLRIRRNLTATRALPPDAIVVAFDWPSQLVYANPARDANEKGRRAFVAGYHLARFLGAFPTGSRVGLVGYSHGGLVVLSALHLLGGGALEDGDPASPPALIPASRHRPRARAVVIASATDQHWLAPGERLGRALAASDGLLCLYNRIDPALVVHPLGKHTDHRAALGRTGMVPRDRGRLGPLAPRYQERDIASLVGVDHHFLGAVSVPSIAAWIAPYVDWPEIGPTPTIAGPDRPAGSPHRLP